MNTEAEQAVGAGHPINCPTIRQTPAACTGSQCTGIVAGFAIAGIPGHPRHVLWHNSLYLDVSLQVDQQYTLHQYNNVP